MGHFPVCRTLLTATSPVPLRPSPNCCQAPSVDKHLFKSTFSRGLVWSDFSLHSLFWLPVLRFQNQGRDRHKNTYHYSTSKCHSSTEKLPEIRHSHDASSHVVWVSRRCEDGTHTPSPQGPLLPLLTAGEPLLTAERLSRHTKTMPTKMVTPRQGPRHTRRRCW